MYSFILNLHHYLAFIAIIFLALATINGFIGSSNECPFDERARKINSMALVTTHIMLLLGLILLAVSPLAHEAFADLGVAMKNAALRKTVVEHPVTNIIAVALATIGNVKSKKSIGHGKRYKASMVFFGLALILILSRLPFEKLF